MDIMKSRRAGKSPDVEIEIENKPAEDTPLKYDDEMEEGMEDPLADFEDEDILKSIQARPALMDIIKKQIVEEKEPMPGEGEVPIEGEEAVEPTQVSGAY